MSILLLNPPNPSPDLQANRDYMGNFGMINTRPGVVLPPLHLIQLGATCSDQSKVHFIDAAAENLSEMEAKERIHKTTVDFSVVMTSTPTAFSDYAFAEWLKAETKSPVFLYGPHAAHTAQEAFEKSGADGILVGYMTKTLDEMLASNGGADLEEIIQPERIPEEPPVGPKFDLNEIGIGIWEKTPLDKYRFDMREPTPFATMRTSLGCVYSCAYCPYVLAEGQRFLPMSPERIYTEMEYLSRKLGVRFILFRDLLFTAQKNRIIELCNLLIEKPLPVTWRAETSTQHLSEDLVRLMARAGCNGMNLGVESVDEASAEEMDLVAKRRSLEQVKQVFHWCTKYGIKGNALFVVGFPEDSRAGIEKSIQFAKELEAETVQFSFAMPFPGTDLAKIAEKDNLIEINEWSQMTSLRPVMHTRHLSRDEVQELGRKALRNVYMHPKRIVRMAMHPLQFIQRAHAFVRFYVGH